MGGSLLLLTVCLGLGAGCGQGARPGTGQADAGRAVRIELEGVEVRQYRGQELGFEFSTSRLTLNQDAGEMTAQGAVEGRLERNLWDQPAVAK